LRTGPSFCGNSHSWRDEEIYLYCNFRAPRPRRLRDGRIVRRILPHVVEQDASERLDGLFDEVVQAASARAAQGGCQRIGAAQPISMVPVGYCRHVGATDALKPTWKSVPVRRVPGRLGYFLYRAHIWLVVDWSARVVRGKTSRYALSSASSALRSSTSSSLPSAGSCVCCGLSSVILTSFLSSAVSLFPGNRTSRPYLRPKPQLTARSRVSLLWLMFA
jgi:hypothetical protein